MSFQRITELATSSIACLPPDERLLTCLAPVRTVFRMCPFVTIEMFLFTTYAWTESALFLHCSRETGSEVLWIGERGFDCDVPEIVHPVLGCHTSDNRASGV